MKKEDCPKFFEFNIFNIILTVIQVIALFGFWNKLTDVAKILYIVIPFMVLMLIINIMKYCFKVKKFYSKYEGLHNNYLALVQNYRDNVTELKQEQYNNEVLREFSIRSINLLMIYNDLPKDERNNIRKKLVTDFINGPKTEEKINEKEIQSSKNY